MNNLDKKDIEIFRHYFLSHDEDMRRNIKSIMPGMLLKYLSIIESEFLRNTNIENIASEIDSIHLVSDLKQLQEEYYSSLAQIVIKGDTNGEIKQLLANDNKSFKKVLSSPLNEQSFEKEVAFAIRDTERAAFKKKFKGIDSEEEYQFEESEIKSAIKQVERESIRNIFENIDEANETQGKVAALIPPGFRESTNVSLNFSRRILKYAVAAAIIGFVFWGSYLIINNKEKRNDDLAKNKVEKGAPKGRVTPPFPAIVEQTIERRLLVAESFGFAKDGSKLFKIVVQNIGKQIDTLKKIYSDEIQGRNGAGYGPVAKAISKQMDSLLSIRNTYSYDSTNKKIVVRLGDDQRVDKIISIDPMQRTNLFIKINNDYYQLKPTMQPLKLISVKNKDTIEEIEKIIFQNS